MQFNDTTNKNGIIQMCEQTLDLGLTAISGNAALLAYFTNLINEWVRNCAFWIWKADGDWHFDDSNHIDFPFSTTTLVDQQYDYAMPTDLLKIRSVEIKKSDGNYTELLLMKNDDARLRDERFQESDGLPTHYRREGRSIILYPKPKAADITLAAGLRIIFNREIDAFTTSDTTQQPGFALQFHPIAYYGPCLVYSMKKGMEDKVSLCNKMLFGGVNKDEDPGLIKMLKMHYSNQDENEAILIRPSFMNNCFE